ncbi:TPA: DEAD/DEAH box helicase family protein [Enterococcus faecalis]|nr:DEAD/DEAH box helicase family protein [Enterococcus faecalis]
MNPEKKEKLLNLYDETFLHVTRSNENFVHFLEQSSFLHKYSVDEQLCIHGQVPDARYLADFNTWKSIGRFVKKGQKAISALRRMNNRMMGFHYFDVTQTYGKKLGFPDYTLSENELREVITADVLAEINELSTAASINQKREAWAIAKQQIEYKAFQKPIEGLQGLTQLQMSNVDYFSDTLELATQMNRLVSKEILLYKTEKERMKENELNLQRERGWRIDPSTSVSGQRTTGEIRDDSTGSLRGKEQGKVHSNADEGDVNDLRTPNRREDEPTNQRTGDTLRGTTTVNTGTTDGHDDRLEDTGTIPPTSHRSSDEGNHWLEESSELSPFHQELIRGTGIEHGKFRIVHFFTQIKQSKLRATFLKNEYGTGGHAGPNMPTVMYNSKGLEIDDLLYSWSTVAQGIEDLLTTDQYLTAEEKEAYHEHQKNLQSSEEKVEKEEKQSESLTEESTSESSQELSLFDFEPEEATATALTTEEVPYIPLPSKAQETDLEGTPHAFAFPEDESFYDTKPKEKIQNNLAAIRLSKQIQREHRYATPEEQTILAKYVGWGGIADIFDTRSDKYAEERQELQKLVTEAQYKQMRQSVLTAYYTDPIIIKSMYETVEHLGFTGGKILDPSMGTGNFFSALPDRLKEASELHGVELDEITGTIAQQLHPKADIQIKGFQEVGSLTNQYDLVISNVPFDQQKITDPQFDKSYSIHNYFLKKAIDSVHDGGIVAIITSTNTMDNLTQDLRLEVKKEAELLGAVRLPNNAFKKIAGTEVTTDILFFQKDQEAAKQRFYSPSWVNVEAGGKELPGVWYNKYFHEHPEQVCGEFAIKHYHGATLTVKPGETPLTEQMQLALSRIQGAYFGEAKTVEQTATLTEEQTVSLDDVPLFTYEVIDDSVYFNDANTLKEVERTPGQRERMKQMIVLRKTLQEVIACQRIPNYDTHVFENLLNQLNQQYDTFFENYGSLSQNQKLLDQDDYIPLLRSIEAVEKDGTVTKTEIFHEATIRPKVEINEVSTALDALYASLGNRLSVDWEYMTNIYPKTREELLEELGTKVFLDPLLYDEENLYGEGWQASEEYLSGDVKTKLAQAKHAAEKYPELFRRNLTALEQVQPTPIKAGDIDFSIGSTWIPTEVYQEFMFETFETRPFYINYEEIALEMEPLGMRYFVRGKNKDQSAIVQNRYGTKRASAYTIFENSLNLKKVEVKDKVVDGDKTTYVLNPTETAYARSKQEQLQEAFQSWVFKDDARTEKLRLIYEERFNRIVPRVYNGEHLVFPGLNERYELRPHQKNVVERIVQSGKALMAHTVGAGKTLSMISAGMLMKDQGLINKPLYVVPNHLTNEFGNELMRFYPAKKVLITNKKDFSKQNRQAFVSKIALGSYDAVIIGHSQFEKIALSPEKQKALLQEEINQVTDAITTYQMEDGSDSWSLKQMIAFEKRLEERLEKLNKTDKKDHQLCFEDLGVDFLFVDEAHQYKNLYSYTKLSNVAGVNSSNSLRASDMEMKCRYLLEKHNHRGVVFATGTPVSNSMSELFTMQKYLQPDILKQYGVFHFDAWASTFGEIVSSLEITPEGTGYQMKNRFAKFHNLPELMQMYNLVSDIQTASMLQLPVPQIKTGKPQVIVTQLTTYQKEKVAELAERAEKIRAKEVTAEEDNMLKITNEGKLMGLDPRLMTDYDPEKYPVEELQETKIAKCAEKVAEIWQETKENKSTQLIFSDSGTPKANQFNIYDELKQQLIQRGVPAEEIAFIHDANNEKQREEIFDAMREGKLRILLGSTSKLGTGTNVQQKLIACHHVDCPWRPSDVEQRDGRIIRQGNENKEVEIYRYVTKGSLDSFLWQIQEQKLTFINQVMTGKALDRSCEELSDTVLEAGDMKAIASGNPKIAEKMKLDNEIARLKLMKRSFINDKESLKWQVENEFPAQIRSLREKRENLAIDRTVSASHNEEEFGITLDGQFFSERSKAAEVFDQLCTLYEREEQFQEIGQYRGLDISVRKDFHEYGHMTICLQGNERYFVSTSLGNGLGGIRKIEFEEQRIPSYYQEVDEQLNKVEDQFEKAKDLRNAVFPQEEELAEKIALQAQLNAEIEQSLAKDSKQTEQKPVIEATEGVEFSV